MQLYIYTYIEITEIDICIYISFFKYISGIPGQCATITPQMFSGVTTIYTHAHLSMWLFASEVSTYYHMCHPGIVSILMLALTYIQAMTLHKHTYSRFNDDSGHILYRIMVTTTSVMGVMKIGNTVPRVGLKPTSLAFRSRVLPSHHIGFLMSPVYVALCLSGQFRLLHTYKYVHVHLRIYAHVFTCIYAYCVYVHMNKISIIWK